MKVARVIPVDGGEFGTFHVRRLSFGAMFSYRNALAYIHTETLPDDEKEHRSILAMLDCTVCDANGKSVDGFKSAELDHELAYTLYKASLEVANVTSEAVAEAKKD